MDCETIRLHRVGDEPEERAAFEAHARTCAGCARLLEEDRALAEQVRVWVDAAPAPRLDLERRISAAIARERSPSRVRRPVFLLAAAAGVLLAVVGATIYLRVLHTPPQGGVEQAVRQVDEAERGYAQAIANLEAASSGVLARASDPALDARSASVLLAYRDRLAHLDSVIAEVRTFLEENPGNAAGHTVLLSAYKDKAQLLREVVNLHPGERS